MRGLVDDAQQALVDHVAVRQKLVEIHRAHHGADVRHRQLENGILEAGNLISRLRRIQHLVEGNPVDRHDGVVAGDYFLGRYVEHLLHHVHPGADAIEKGNDNIEAGRERPGIASEALDRVVIALRHGLDARKKQEKNKDDQKRNDDVEARKRHQALPWQMILKSGFTFGKGSCTDVFGHPCASEAHPSYSLIPAGSCPKTAMHFSGSCSDARKSADCQHRPAEERVKGDLRALQSAAVRMFFSQIQPASSLRTSASITIMPSSLSFRQGMWLKFLPPA